MQNKEKIENIIFVMAYYHQEILYEIFTDDERCNDYDKCRRVKELAKEFMNSNWDNEDEDLEDTTRNFLISIENKE